MDLIAREHRVSSTSVARILRLTEDRIRKNYLPRILSIYEFKSVNTVDASMSVNLIDLEAGHIFDILADSRQRYLFEYFNSYPLKVRKKVEYNDMVEDKNNKIKVIKRVFYGYRSFRNFKTSIMLMERYKYKRATSIAIGLLWMLPHNLIDFVDLNYHQRYLT